MGGVIPARRRGRWSVLALVSLGVVVAIVVVWAHRRAEGDSAGPSPTWTATPPVADGTSGV